MYRLYEGLQRLRYRVRQGRDDNVVAADGYPLPPANLRVLVAGTADIGWFVNSGKLTTDVIEALLLRNGHRIEDTRSIFDFGCGCGRIIRHWHSPAGARIVGTDYNPRLIDWCSKNLPFARFITNDLAPPLPDLGGDFELIYSFSVFTHLTADLQQTWMEELSRVLAPGGFLAVTTHGERFVDRLSADEIASFRAGHLVVKYEEVVGTNLCAAFHPQSYLFGEFARDLQVIDFIAGGTIEGIEQDLTLLRKPRESETRAASGPLRIVQ